MIFDGDTEIDVVSVDQSNKRVFAGECKYQCETGRCASVFALKEKVNNATEIRKAFPGYEVIYGVFSKKWLYAAYAGYCKGKCRYSSG